MAHLSRVASSVLFGSGVALVLVGMSASLGFSVAGIVASVAAVAALLYTGGVWFSDRGNIVAPSVLVFDRSLRIIGSTHAGKPIVDRFPVSMRDEIQRRCAAAVAGHASRFTCRDGSRERVFEVARVVSGGPSEIAGVLVEGGSVGSQSVPYDAAIGII